MHWIEEETAKQEKQKYYYNTDSTYQVPTTKHSLDQVIQSSRYEHHSPDKSYIRPNSKKALI